MYPAVQAAYFEASFLKYSFCFQESLYFCVCRHQAALKYLALCATRLVASWRILPRSLTVTFERRVTDWAALISISCTLVFLAQSIFFKNALTNKFFT